MTRLPRLSAILATIPALAACAGAPETPAQTPAPQPVKVRVAAVQEQGVDVNYVTTATIRGKSTALITSKAMGHVEKLHVDAGDDVERGELLVELDARDARAGRAQALAAAAQAKAAIKRAESDLKAARVQRDMAELTWERMRKLGEQGAVTDQQRDQAESALDGARAREQVAEAALHAAESQLNQARANQEMAAAHLDYREVRAPFAGRVVQKMVDVGDLAAPGAPLLKLEDVDRLRAEAIVDESQAGRIEVGQKAHVTVDATGGEIEGTVGEIVPAVDEATRAFVVKVDIPQDAQVAHIQPGMFARVKFPVGAADRLMVPTSAVSRRGSLERIFVHSEGLARLRLVTTGDTRNGETEILSGLSPGEEIILDPAPVLADATSVEVTP